MDFRRISENFKSFKRFQGSSMESSKGFSRKFHGHSKHISDCSRGFRGIRKFLREFKGVQESCKRDNFKQISDGFRASQKVQWVKKGWISQGSFSVVSKGVQSASGAFKSTSGGYRNRSGFQ